MCVSVFSSPVAQFLIHLGIKQQVHTRRPHHDFLSLHGNAETISFAVCLFCVGHAVNKWRKFGSRCFVEGFSEWDEIWRIDRGALLYIGAPCGFRAVNKWVSV